MQDTCDVFGQRESILYRRDVFTIDRYREQWFTRVFVMASNHLRHTLIKSMARYPRFRGPPPKQLLYRQPKGPN